MVASANDTASITGLVTKIAGGSLMSKAMADATSHIPITGFGAALKDSVLGAASLRAFPTSHLSGTTPDASLTYVSASNVARRTFNFTNLTPSIAGSALQQETSVELTNQALLQIDNLGDRALAAAVATATGGTLIGIWLDELLRLDVPIHLALFTLICGLDFIVSQMRKSYLQTLRILERLRH